MENYKTISTSSHSAKLAEPIIIEETGTTRKVLIVDLNNSKIDTGETVGITITIPTYSAVNHTTLKMFDIYGNLLKSITITESTTTVDISGYPSGVYVVRIMNEKGIVSKRIIKR